MDMLSPDSSMQTNQKCMDSCGLGSLKNITKLCTYQGTKSKHLMIRKYHHGKQYLLLTTNSLTHMLIICTAFYVNHTSIKLLKFLFKNLMIKIALFCVNDALNDSFQDFTSKLTARAKEENSGGSCRLFTTTCILDAVLS